MKNEYTWRAYLKEEEAHAFTGWDFSYLDGRMRDDRLPWSYRAKLADFLKPDTKLLDMGTGGGEFLLSLNHPYQLTSVTEGYEPNYRLCKQRLHPLGISVHKYEGEGLFSFGDEEFHVVINRHENFNLSEVFRVLKPNGFFITQQVGGRNNDSLAQRVIPNFSPSMPDFNLENQLPAFKKAGFRIMYRNQSYPRTYFSDIGAVCYYMKILPWEFPGFSVDSCFEGLMKLQAEIEEHGEVETDSQRFILIAKKEIK